MSETCPLIQCAYGGTCTCGTCICQGVTRGKYCEVVGEARQCGLDVVCQNGGSCIPGATSVLPATCDCSGIPFTGLYARVKRSFVRQPNASTILNFLTQAPTPFRVPVAGLDIRESIVKMQRMGIVVLRAFSVLYTLHIVLPM